MDNLVHVLPRYVYKEIGSNFGRINSLHNIFTLTC